jgi:uncharacterized protein (DUF427 family)
MEAGGQDHHGDLMPAEQMREPGPDHPITVEPNPNRIVVRFNGHTVVDTTRALTLREASYPPVQYVPREDADMALLERTERSTRCPYKGDASYYSIKVGGRTAGNAVWSYEEPYSAVAVIKGHLAFYPDRVDAIEELSRAGTGHCD